MRRSSRDLQKFKKSDFFFIHLRLDIHYFASGTFVEVKAEKKKNEKIEKNFFSIYFTLENELE